MTVFLRSLLPLRTDRRAVTALEYALIGAAVVAIGLAGFSVVGTDIAAKYTAISDAMT